MLTDVIAAQATPPGRSAVALLRVSGGGSHNVAARVLEPFAVKPCRQARLATLVGGDDETLDEVLYVTFRGPHSYTGEDSVEISTHGGLLVPLECLNALLNAGARLAEPGEFTRRALANGKIDLLQAEAIGDLVDATAPAQRRTAIDQLDRGLSQRISVLRKHVLNIEALVSYDIDFPEEDSGPVAPSEIASATEQLIQALSQLLASAAEGQRLKEGALAVIAGQPNVGKSSLFNALLGVDRAIVTDIPGTTRDAVEAAATCGGFPFVLVDTAGLRTATDQVEKLGVEVSHRYLKSADLVLLCAEQGRSLTPEEEQFRDTLAVPCVTVRTKSDLAATKSADGTAVSVESGEGLEALRAELAQLAFSTLSAQGNVHAVLTRERHRAAVTRAREEVEHFVLARNEGVDMVVAAVHLRAAVTALDDIIGVVTPDDVLDVVFGTFCVGK